jgi:hypothetical protein
VSGANILKGSALILGSSTLNPRAAEIIQGALSPFMHHLVEMQRIDLGGRTIVALLVNIDPAHVNAIEAELQALAESSGIDIAIEMK